MNKKIKHKHKEHRQPKVYSGYKEKQQQQQSKRIQHGILIVDINMFV